MSESLTIEPAGHAHLPDIAILVEAARWPHRLEDIRPAIDLGYGLVARLGERERLVGVAALWLYGERAARIGLVIVPPDLQGRGIGRRLVDELLREAGSRAVMLLTTPSGQPLYEKLDFRTVGGALRHQGEYRHTPVTDPRIRPASPGDLERVAEIDANALGADRREILAHLHDAGRTSVLVEAGRLTGYAVQRPFGFGTVVGPIVANSEEDAIALFDASAAPGFVRVDRPSEALLLGRHLEKAGLMGDESSGVMTLGTWPACSGPARIYAMAGHAWG